MVNELRNTFASHKTQPIQFRLIQLRKLYWGLVDYEAAIRSALHRDLGKPIFEAYAGEIEWCKNDIIFTCQNLAKWAKEENAPDVPLLNILVKPKIRKVPLGCALIIGAFNVPFQLTLSPLIGAIAAGNTAIIKPSEGSPHCSAVIAEVTSRYLDPTCYRCVQGSVAETTALLDQKWDKIFYTGGVKVAKIIAKKAAETLTPYTLELGGRNPALVTAKADLRLAARRLTWGKIHNAGQICFSQNYILIDKAVLQEFVAEVRAALQCFYPDGTRSSPDYGRIANKTHWQRIKSLVDTSGGKVLLGGAMDEVDLFIEPTVIQVNDINDVLIANETLGPIMTLFPTSSLSEAISIANQVHSTPLATYSFGTRSETRRVLNEIKSGGASVNDAWMHGTVPTLAFGGVGDSGTGSYRGRASFESFIHRQSYTTTPGWAERLFDLRYPPYGGKLETYLKLTALRPDFDREGMSKGYLSGLLVGLSQASRRAVDLIVYSLSLLSSSAGRGRSSNTKWTGEIKGKIEENEEN
ncbi:MAG: hypothetical protein Q9216_001829 [Gyalolechia sp. 2 TL-2023]